MRTSLSDEALVAALARVTALGRAEDWDAFNAHIEAIIPATANAGQLWRLAETNPFWESVFAEEGPTPAIVRAVTVRIRGFDEPRDVASALALATRMLAVHPGMTVLGDEAVGRKEYPGDVADGLLAVARESVDSTDRGVRIAAAHTLGCCCGVDASDAVRLAGLARAEDPVMAATAVLSLAAVAWRTRRSDHAVPSADGDAPLLLACACIAHRVGIDGSLEPSDGESLARAIRASEPLPPEWGWRWGPGRADETTAHLALKIASRVRWHPDAAAPLVAALAEWAHRLGRLEYLHDDVLLDAVFATPAPRLGYALEDLTAVQREALSALAYTEQSLLLRFGFYARDIPAFLAGSGGLWLPLEVRTPAGTQQWHLVRLWRETILGGLDENEAVRAIVEGLEPAAALTAICNGARGVLLMMSSRPASQRTDVEELRDTELVLRIVSSLVSRGFDASTALRDMLDSSRRWDSTTTGRVIASVHALGGAQPHDGDVEYLAWARRFTSAGSPVHAMIDALDTELRARVDARAAELGVPRA